MKATSNKKLPQIEQLFNNYYFSDWYQMFPKHGYTASFLHLLRHTNNVNFFFTPTPFLLQLFMSFPINSSSFYATTSATLSLVTPRYVKSQRVATSRNYV